MSGKEAQVREGAPFDGQNSMDQGGKLNWIVLPGDLSLISQTVKVYSVVSPPSDTVRCYWFTFWSIFKQFSFSKILIIRNIPSAGLGHNYLLWSLDQSKFLPAKQNGPHWLLCCLHNFCYSLWSMLCPERCLWKAAILGGGVPDPHLREPWGREWGRGKCTLISFFHTAFFICNNFFYDIAYLP